MSGLSQCERPQQWTAEALEARVVRYRELVPCVSAFIDTRTPGSNAKENFTLIGPGVSENADQHVHISEPHGFNIGGARQPPGCVNSQHSHETAEVIVVHSGRWRFTFGENGTDAVIEAGPGDVASFPTHAFRGFENIGDETGFLFFVLGGDDPGRVLWAPKVFELAEEYGLVLLDNGALIDTAAGQALPADARPMPVTDRETIARLRRMRASDEDEVIARALPRAVPGETLIIGEGGQMPPTDGFTLWRSILARDEASAATSSSTPEVVFVQRGGVQAIVEDAAIALGKGDTMTVPRELVRSYKALDEGAELIVVRGID